jgi:hypothetical protein
MSIEFKQDTDIYNIIKTVFNPKDYDNNDSNFENLNVNKNTVLNNLIVSGTLSTTKITNNNTTPATFGIYDIGYYLDYTALTTVQIPTSNLNTQLFTLTLPCYGLWSIQTIFSINTVGGNTLAYRDMTITSGATTYFRSLSRTSATIASSGVLATINDSFTYNPTTLDPLIVSIVITFSGTGTINVSRFNAPLLRCIRLA